MGISAFRSLDAAVFGTATALGLESGCVAACGGGFLVRAGPTAIGRRKDLAAGLAAVDFAEVAFIFPVIDVSVPFDGAVLALAALPATGCVTFAADLRAGSATDLATCLEAPDFVAPDLPAGCFALSEAAAALTRDRDSGLEGFEAGLLLAEDDVSDAGGTFAFDADTIDLDAVDLDALAWTAARACVFVADEAAPVLPRGAAAALAFGGMGEPLLNGMVPMAGRRPSPDVPKGSRQSRFGYASKRPDRKSASDRTA